MNMVQGGVVWTRGNFTVRDGIFRHNVASLEGGAVFASADSSVTLSGGVFVANQAKDGGVVQVDFDATTLVQGGEYSQNLAQNNGGVVFVIRTGNLEVGVYPMSRFFDLWLLCTSSTAASPATHLPPTYRTSRAIFFLASN